VRVTRQSTGDSGNRGNEGTPTKPEDPGALKVFEYKNGVLTNEVSIAPKRREKSRPRATSISSDQAISLNTNTSFVSTPFLYSKTFSAPGSSGLVGVPSFPRLPESPVDCRCHAHLMSVDAGVDGPGCFTSSPA